MLRNNIISQPNNIISQPRKYSKTVKLNVFLHFHEDKGAKQGWTDHCCFAAVLLNRLQLGRNLTQPEARQAKDMKKQKALYHPHPYTTRKAQKEDRGVLLKERTRTKRLTLVYPVPHIQVCWLNCCGMQMCLQFPLSVRHGWLIVAKPVIRWRS